MIYAAMSIIALYQRKSEATRSQALRRWWEMNLLVAGALALALGATLVEYVVDRAQNSN